jgi:hypothetical protein
MSSAMVPDEPWHARAAGATRTLCGILVAGLNADALHVAREVGADPSNDAPACVVCRDLLESVHGKTWGQP